MNYRSPGVFFSLSLIRLAGEYINLLRCFYNYVLVGYKHLILGSLLWSDKWLGQFGCAETDRPKADYNLVGVSYCRRFRPSEVGVPDNNTYLAAIGGTTALSRQ